MWREESSPRDSQRINSTNVWTNTRFDLTDRNMKEATSSLTLVSFLSLLRNLTCGKWVSIRNRSSSFEVGTFGCVSFFQYYISMHIKLHHFILIPRSIESPTKITPYYSIPFKQSYVHLLLILTDVLTSVNTHMWTLVFVDDVHTSSSYRTMLFHIPTELSSEVWRTHTAVNKQILFRSLSDIFKWPKGQSAVSFGEPEKKKTKRNTNSNKKEKKPQV